MTDQSVPPPPSPPGQPGPPPSQPPPVPSGGASSAKRTWLIVAIVVATLVIVGVVVAVVLSSGDGEKPKPKPSLTSPTASASSSATTAAGWSGDSSARTVTLPARTGEGHGCLSKSVSLVDGEGSGNGVIGNGSAGPIQVVLAGDPMVGAFTAGGPRLTIYPLYCYAAGSSADQGVMIDVAALNAAGKAVPLAPSDPFDVVFKSMTGTSPAYFPVFDAGSLKLTSRGPIVNYVGVTTPSQTDNFEFELTMGGTSTAIHLGAISTKK